MPLRKDLVTVLVCGGRDYGEVPRARSDPWWNVKNEERGLIDTVLTSADEEYDGIQIIAGDATGADKAALKWAKWTDRPSKKYKAKWLNYGKAAGPIRNQQMLDQGCPSLVVAFPGGKGTANMVKLAKKAGIPVEEYNWPTEAKPVFQGIDYDEEDNI